MLIHMGKMALKIKIREIFEKMHVKTAPPPILSLFYLFLKLLWERIIHFCFIRSINLDGFWTSLFLSINVGHASFLKIQ